MLLCYIPNEVTVSGLNKNKCNEQKLVITGVCAFIEQGYLLEIQTVIGAGMQLMLRI